MEPKEPEVMRMLHQIREQLYEEMKDLSDEEWVKKIKQESEEFKKKYGLKLRQRVIVRK